MARVGREAVAQVDHRARSRAREREPGRELRLGAAVPVDQLRGLGNARRAVEQEQPGRRAAELAGDPQLVTGPGTVAADELRLVVGPARHGRRSR